MNTYKTLVATIKAELKADVASLMAARKKEIPWTACTWKYTTWRAKHIAYCLFRGKTIEQIEGKRRDPHAGQHAAVDYHTKRFLTAWTAECAEDIAAWVERNAERAAAKVAQ